MKSMFEMAEGFVDGSVPLKARLSLTDAERDRLLQHVLAIAQQERKDRIRLDKEIDLRVFKKVTKEMGMETRLRRRVVTHDGDISVDGKKYTVPLPAGTCVKVFDSGEIIPLPQGVSSSSLYLNGFEPVGSL